MSKATGELVAEANDRIDELRKTIDALAEADAEERRCSYKSCPEEQREAERRIPLRDKVLTWAAGIAQGFTAGAVIWLLYQQWAIWKATAEATVEALQ